MTDIPKDSLIPTPIKYNVLMMTAAVISCEAISEIEAAQRALAEGPSVLDPRQLQWVVKYVSDKPIYLGDPVDDAEPQTDDALQELAAEAQKHDMGYPNPDEPPKLEIVK